MRLNPFGMVFDDVYELNYEVLSELELEVKPDGKIYDPSKGSILSFNGNIIIASINPNEVHYAGQGEIELDLLNNVRMTTVLFADYLKKKQAKGMPFVSYFPEEKVETVEDEEIKYTNLTVKFDNTRSISSEFFHNKCLKFLDLIFKMEENNADLRNFDSFDDIK